MLALSGTLSPVGAADGKWTISAVEESDGEPRVARIELTRPTVSRGGNRPTSRVKRLRIVRPLPGRTAVEAGFGFVLDGPTNLNLSEGGYEFRVSRGPEYRVIGGNSTIEKTSSDEHVFALPRILNMRQLGWTSGDCFVPWSRENLPIRMTAEDLHVAMAVANPVAREGDDPAKKVVELRARRRRHEEPPLSDPLWIGNDVNALGGLAFYGSAATGPDALATGSESEDPSETDSDLAALQLLARLASQRRDSSAHPLVQGKVAVENPFAWPLPVYLASDQVDGYFVLGDWLRLDRPITQTKSGRPYSTSNHRTAISLGREAEQIGWELLDAGFRMAPLAGSGDERGLHPVGYNRLYVAGESIDSSSSSSQPVESAEQWWQGVWEGRSFATNGPLLIANLDGKLPGHVFRVDAADPIQLRAELTLTVQDPVDYLEVIYNGQVHYSAKLDEYAKAGGKIPPLHVDRSGWALIRVVTLYENHFRAATTAPWYFEVDGERRITRSSIEFFQNWLAEYETYLRSQPDADLNAYAPFIRSARDFWQSRLQAVNAN
ncbi:CehA/McbA family metallohydrolase domain-containing protein [Allorhodopirellula solitaria]|uniref:hypothetical protein n=1 Tax=Allorhodopirellula solitaria TaxID=2527987 RepID=UPI001FE9DE40|nr:hypothetical protein [Allorhodopirellula solitaria]